MLIFKNIKNFYFKGVKLLKGNIQINQTLILSLVLFIGVYFYNLNISYLEIFTIFTTVILLDLFFVKYKTGKWYFPFSGVNAGFGISFFLRSSDLILYVFAGILAIVGKNIFRIKGKHFMNPSNMGVFITLILFPQFTWTNPLQWGQSVQFEEYIYVLILILILGFFIILRLFKLHNLKFYDLILAFLITHLVLFFTITQESTLNSIYLFFNASFLIFLFFMLTDPKTNFKDRHLRIIYGISVAVLFYILQFYINENYSLLASLFFMTLIIPIIRYFSDKNIIKSRMILFLILFFMLILLGLHIYYYGLIDLLFDNRCNQLICN